MSRSGEHNNPISSKRKFVHPGIYRHFKGNIYHVLGVTEEIRGSTKLNVFCVLYIPQHGDYAGLLANRDLAMFQEMVDRPELQYKGPRFNLIEVRDMLTGFRCHTAPDKSYRVLGISENTENGKLSVANQMIGGKDPDKLFHYELPQHS